MTRAMMTWTAKLACGCKAAGDGLYPLESLVPGSGFRCRAHGETKIVAVAARGK